MKSDGFRVHQALLVGAYTVRFEDYVLLLELYRV